MNKIIGFSKRKIYSKLNSLELFFILIILYFTGKNHSKILSYFNLIKKKVLVNGRLRDLASFNFIKTLFNSYDKNINFLKKVKN